MARFIRTMFLLLMLLNVLSSFGQIKFNNLTQEHGLSNANVNCILEDHNGFMWFGTNDGLNRFDGYNFTIFRNSTKDSSSISSNYITCLHEDSNGIIWIGTKGGSLNAYDSKKGRFFHFNLNNGDTNLAGSKDVLSITEDLKQNIWIGTDGAGIYKLNLKTEKLEPFNLENSSEVLAIIERADNQVWLGTWSEGLNCFNYQDGDIEQVKSDYGIRINRVWTMESDSQYIWVGTFGSGLAKINMHTKKAHWFQLSTNEKNDGDKVIWTICKSINGLKWVGTDNGLYQIGYSDQVISHFTQKDNNVDGLPSDKVIAIYESKNGIMWIGTDKGICFVDPKPKKFQVDLGIFEIENSNINAMTRGSGNSIWIASNNNTITHLTPQTSKLLDFDVKVFTNCFDESKINCLYEDLYRRLWIGTRYGIHISDEKGNHIKQIVFDSVDIKNSCNDVTSICASDKNGIYWIGTDNGLFLVNSFNWSITKYDSFTLPGNGLNSKHILNIFKDRKDCIWVATWKGVFKFSHETNTFHACSNEVLNNLYVNTIYDDALGHIWLGSRNGLYKYIIETNETVAFREEDGLCNNNICSIVDDNIGNLWLSTTNGLSKLDLTTFNIKNFDTHDGLLNENYNPNVGLLVSNEFIFLGGLVGLDVFDPNQIEIDTTETKVVFNDFKIFNKEVEIGGKDSPLKRAIEESSSIIITSKQGVFSIGFVALNYINAERCEYLFKLEGFETDWNNAGLERKATYTNLNSGDYTFKVRATNQDGVWSSSEVMLDITVLPPWWKTRWFKVSLVLFLFSVLFLYNGYRNHTYNQRKLQLKNTINDRTSEIRKQKDKLEKQAEELKKTNLLLNDKTKEIQQQADEIQRMNLLLKVRNLNLSEDVEELSRARVMNESVSFEEFQEIYPDDESCKMMIYELKSEIGFVCSSCQNTSYVKGTAPFSRRCKKCGYTESITVGTIFYRMKFPIVKAFYILYLVSGGHKLTVDQLSEIVSLRRETCWTFKVKVEDHMKQNKRFKNKQEGWKELILIMKKT